MDDGPYCKPIELLQEHKHGARHTQLEGTEARKGGEKGQKTAFHLLQMKRKHNLLNRVISSRAGITASARNLQCMRDVADFLFVFSLYFHVVKNWRSDDDGSFFCGWLPLSCSLVTNPGILRGESWHHPSFHSPFSPRNTTDLPLLYSPSPLALAELRRRRRKRRKRRRMEAFMGILDIPAWWLGCFGLLMTLLDQHKLQLCSPGVLAHVYKLNKFALIFIFLYLRLPLGCREAPSRTPLPPFSGC